MRKVFKWIKMILLGFGILILLITLTVFIFVNTSPQFGGKPSEEDKINYSKTGHFEEGKFVNLIPTSMDMDFAKIRSILRDQLKSDPTRTPSDLLPSQQATYDHVPDSVVRMTWFGHSAILLQIGGKNIMIDPMFGSTPSPHPWLGGSRYKMQVPWQIEQLPHLDAIVLSHDHYDHLDYGSILKLKDKTDKFYVPLGVDAHLKSWGINNEDIIAGDWWDEFNMEEITLVCAPARHFSGRGFTRNQTLWASWIVMHGDSRIYFSGDGGYGPHFKEIGEKYGPFDFAMMECGQYDKRWDNIHMMPEETAQAAKDVNANWMMPIHWGAFTLALHSWTDPADRVVEAANQLGIRISTPMIGETFVIKDNDLPADKWWKQLN